MRRLYGLVNGGGAAWPLAAGAEQQKRYMWSRFSTTLFRTFTWMDDGESLLHSGAGHCSTDRNQSHAPSSAASTTTAGRSSCMPTAVSRAACTCQVTVLHC